MKTIAVVLACHNRREQTLRCLEILFAQQLDDSLRLDVYLSDNGSHDGTSEAVRAKFPQVTVVMGDGGLYWRGGMALAWSQVNHSDFTLWLNDDVMLAPAALAALWQTYCEARDPGTIVVGAIENRQTQTVEWGGKRMGSWWLFRFDTLAPTDEPQRCVTFNGNLVLIPESTRKRIGGLSGRYPCTLADYDYGLRANRAGIPIWLAPGVLGFCESNSFARSYRNPSLPRRTRWRLICGPRGLPPRAYWHFIRDYAPKPKFAYWLGPYVKVLIGLKGRIS